jgi:hypothetical protein
MIPCTLEKSIHQSKSIKSHPSRLYCDSVKETENELLAMSRVFYKFRSAKDYDTYKLDGGADGIPVWELKREIVMSKRLHKATDFDLLLANAQSGEPYTEDTQIIPRNAQVVVKRVPLGVTKKGGAYAYASIGSQSMGILGNPSVGASSASGKLSFSPFISTQPTLLSNPLPFLIFAPRI